LTTVIRKTEIFIAVMQDDSWCVITQEAEAKAEFEAELRQQLARQAAAHSDHLVSVLHAQRLKLEAEFEKQLIENVKTEKLKMMKEISAVVNRLNAIESAVNGQLHSLYLFMFLSVLFTVSQN